MSSLPYLAIDPGITTGWALMQEGKPKAMGKVPFEEVFDFLLEDRWKEIQLYVVENYRIRPQNLTGGWMHQWSNGEPLQVIGAVKCIAQARSAQVVLQEPAILPLAAKVTGFPYNPKKHVDDEHSAVLHGAYYWFKENGPDAMDETSIGSEDSDGVGVQSTTRIAQISSYSGLRGARRKASVEVQRKRRV